MRRSSRPLGHIETKQAAHVGAKSDAKAARLVSISRHKKRGGDSTDARFNDLSSYGK
jgi:hypothetical protein